MKGFLSRSGARLKKKLGPFPTWVWVVAALGGLVYYRRKHAGGATTDAANAVGSTSSDGTDYWTGQPSGYGSGGGGGSTTGSGDPGGGAGPDPGPIPSPGGGDQPPPGEPQPPGKGKKPRHRGKPPHSGHPKPHVPSGHSKQPKPKGRTRTHKAQPVHSRGSGPARKPAATHIAAHAEPSRRPVANVQHARHTVSKGIVTSHPTGAPVKGGGGAPAKPPVHKRVAAAVTRKKK